MFVQSYLNTAEEILKQYHGEQPLHFFLKKYFSLNKKFGSRDRKYIGHLCYCFFRLGKALAEIKVSEKLAVALFLCDETKSPLLEKINSELNEQVNRSLEEKLQLAKVKFAFNENDLFPFKENLSDSIDAIEFSRSLLIQPLVYLRVRPGREGITKKKLVKAIIKFDKINANSLSVEQTTKLEEVIDINKDAVIQDLNSQRVFDSFIKHLHPQKEIKTAWDCCAASGGKSILLKDIVPDVELTVSDIRESILINLKKRFEQAGIKNYRKMVADIATSPLKEIKKFDLIICDAPCSGSGTWSRTPEQLYFFDEKKIDYYSSLQKKIAANAVKNLKRGGFFVYVTCSVFKKENEEMVQFLQKELSLHLLSSEYLKGYRQKADTLFTTVFTL